MATNAHALVSDALCLPPVQTLDFGPRKSMRAHLPFLPRGVSPVTSSSLLGSPLLFQRTLDLWSLKNKTKAVFIRAEQSTRKSSSSLDVWLGRFAMIGFASAITVEIATGKGLLENFGFATPLPTVALAVTGLVGVLTAVFIFQSATED